MSEALTREQVKLWTIGDVNAECSACRWVAESDYAALRAQLEAQTARAERAELKTGLTDFSDARYAEAIVRSERVEGALRSQIDITNQERGQKESLSAQIAYLTAKLTAMTQERDKWKLDHELLCDDYGQLKQQLAASEQRVLEVEQHVRDLQASYVHLGARHMELQGVLRDSQDELFTAMQRVHEVKERLPYPHELVDAQATIDAQFRESTSLNECITALDWQLTEAHATIARLQEAFATVRQRPTEMSALSQAFEQAHTKKECEQLHATVEAQEQELMRLRALRTACRAIPVWSAKYAPSMNAPFDPITFGVIMGELAQAIDAIERALAGGTEGA